MMIIQYLGLLSRKNIVLASSSPRRKEILQILGLDVRIIPSNFVEDLDPTSFNEPSQYVMATAKGKSEEVAGRLLVDEACPDLIIGADTCVALDGNVYGKPKDENDAVDMLSKLSGKVHDVVTGVCLMIRQRGGSEPWRKIVFYEKTLVHFANLNQELIRAYVRTGESLDKAGGYGIQSLGATLIEGINGDYFNVMGFPLHSFSNQLLDVVKEWDEDNLPSR